jgi:hypothetical protein
MVKINVDLISEVDKRIIGMRFLSLVEKFYENPKNEKAFQKGLKNKHNK